MLIYKEIKGEMSMGEKLYDLTNEIFFKISDYIKDEDLAKTRNILYGILDKYNIERKSTELSVVFQPDINEEIIKNFKVCKRVEGTALSSLKKNTNLI